MMVFRHFRYKTRHKYLRILKLTHSNKNLLKLYILIKGIKEVN